MAETQYHRADRGLKASMWLAAHETTPPTAGKRFVSLVDYGTGAEAVGLRQIEAGSVTVIESHDLLHLLYPNVAPAEVSQAASLAASAAEQLNEAIRGLQTGDRIIVANALLSAAATTAAAMSSPQLADAPRLILSSLFNAIRGAAYVDLTEQQVVLLRDTLRAWYEREPFLSFERAMALVDGLEQAGLRISPIGLTELLDWAAADDDGVR